MVRREDDQGTVARTLQTLGDGVYVRRDFHPERAQVIVDLGFPAFANRPVAAYAEAVKALAAGIELLGPARKVLPDQADAGGGDNDRLASERLGDQESRQALPCAARHDEAAARMILIVGLRIGDCPLLVRPRLLGSRRSNGASHRGGNDAQPYVGGQVLPAGKPDLSGPGAQSGNILFSGMDDEGVGDALAALEREIVEGRDGTGVGGGAFGGEIRLHRPEPSVTGTGNHVDPVQGVPELVPDLVGDAIGEPDPVRIEEVAIDGIRPEAKLGKPRESLLRLDLGQGADPLLELLPGRAATEKGIGIERGVDRHVTFIVEVSATI